MTNLNNLQNQITQNNQRLQLQEKILSELRNDGLDVVQKFSPQFLQGLGTEDRPDYFDAFAYRVQWRSLY